MINDHVFDGGGGRLPLVDAGNRFVGAGSKDEPPKIPGSNLPTSKIIFKVILIFLYMSTT